jgi:hypothetical protein
MVEQPEQATAVPAHHSMRWHHLCRLIAAMDALCHLSSQHIGFKGRR